jgi:hypothetical protein
MSSDVCSQIQKWPLVGRTLQKPNHKAAKVFDLYLRVQFKY